MIRDGSKFYVQVKMVCDKYILKDNPKPRRYAFQSPLEHTQTHIYTYGIPFTYHMYRTIQFDVQYENFFVLLQTSIPFSQFSNIHFEEFR